MANIRDIAKQSGYSVATVSRILNNSGYASEKAKRKVMSIVKENDYKQNRIARSLSIGKTGVIGLVIQDAVQGYYLEIMKGALKRSFDQDYQLLILQSNYQKDRELKFLRLLQEKAIDGLIFTSHSLTLDEIINYKNYGRIVICHDPKDKNIPAVFTNREESYLDAFDWMKNQGVKKIGLALGRSEKESYSSKIILKSLHTIYNSKVNEITMRTNAISYEDGYKMAKEFKDVEGILTSSDDVAAGMYQYFVDNERKIPYLIGQDCQTSGKMLRIPSINHNLEKIGEKTVDLLISGKNEKKLLNSKFELDNLTKSIVKFKKDKEI